MPSLEKISRPLTQAEFCRRFGASPPTISRMIRDGRLPVDGDGLLAMPQAGEIYRNERAGIKGLGALPATPASELREAKQRADLRERIAKAERVERENRERAGELVELVEVQADAERAAAAIRQALLSLPQRISTQLAEVCARPEGPPKAPEIEALVLDEVNRALVHLHKTRFGE